MDTTQLGKPFYRGAEAELFYSTFHPWRTVIKHRVRKAYRNSSLDDKIGRERTIAEASILHEAKAAGAKVPSIIRIELETNTIIMTQIEGTVARQALDKMKLRDATKIFRSLGNQLGSLHAAGIVHGDLTTSNVIVTASGVPFIVDFGLSRRSLEPEDMGVDLHLLQRSITASHVQDGSTLIKALMEGYRESAGEKVASSTVAKAREIARRGRYFAIR